MSNNSSVTGWAVLATIGGTAWYWSSDSDWAVQNRTAAKYGVPYDKVSIVGARPHDCDFMTAPIGEKGCSYKRDYLVEWMALSTANRPITYGSLQADPPTTCSVAELDFQHQCHEVEIPPNERPGPGWHARYVEIHWKKVEE